MPDLHTIHHDGVSHNPLGAGSYVFRKNLITHLTQYCNSKPRILLHIGAQPNSSPHMGTLVSFAVAFALAKRIRDDPSTLSADIMISLDLVDTAPSEQFTKDGVIYQRSQRHTGEMKKYIDDFKHVMQLLHSYSGIPWRIRNQEEFLMSHPDIHTIVEDIVRRRDELAKSLAPETGCLAIRSTCPHAECGLSDKHGIRNVYNDDDKTIVFHCPYHGQYIVDTKTSSGVSRLEFNAPLRNLLRAMTFTRDTDATWIRVTGADYAGYYQEQLLWRHISDPLLIFYSPLILDWSGAKLSKSLYVEEGAYKYFDTQNLDYLVSYEKFKQHGKDFRIIYDEVTNWVQEPFRLFRSYSVYYIDGLFPGH